MDTGLKSWIEVTRVGYRSQEFDTGHKSWIQVKRVGYWKMYQKIGRQVTRIGYLEIGCMQALDTGHKSRRLGDRSQEWEIGRQATKLFFFVLIGVFRVASLMGLAIPTVYSTM